MQQSKMAFCTLVFNNKGKETAKVSLLNPNSNNDIILAMESRNGTSEVITDIAEFRKLIQENRLRFDGLKCNYETERRTLVKDEGKEKEAFHFVDAGMIIRTSKGDEVLALAEYETNMRNISDALDVPVALKEAVDEKFELIIQLKPGESGKIFLLFSEHNREDQNPGIPKMTLTVKEGSGPIGKFVKGEDVNEQCEAKV